MNTEQINNFHNLANQFLGSFSEIAVPLANNLNINGMNNLCTIPYSTIHDTLNDIKICVVIPGVAKESIQIRYNSNILTIEGRTSMICNDWSHLNEKTYNNDGAFKQKIHCFRSICWLWNHFVSGKTIGLYLFRN